MHVVKRIRISSYINISRASCHNTKTLKQFNKLLSIFISRLYNLNFLWVRGVRVWQ